MRTPRHTRFFRTFALILAVTIITLLAGMTAGCRVLSRLRNQSQESETTSTTPSTETSVEPTVTTSETTSTDKSTETATDVEGPTATQSGKAMWVVVAAIARTEPLAQEKLNRLGQLLGADENTYVVDSSSHYRGIKPGWWVVIEATKTRAGALDEARWARRGAYTPIVRYVTKTCNDPIQTQSK